MEQPLVSILIPFKNTATFLHECLTSIIKQTYTNWEIIAIDDSSKDNSYNIVFEFTLSDQRIRVIKNKGAGIIRALQTAYQIANGEIITRMDSDDIMKPNRIVWMVNHLLKYGKGHIALGQVKYFSERGISNGYQRYEKWLNQLTKYGDNYSEIYKECVIPSPCWMVFKEDLDSCGAFDSNTYPEDYDLAFRFYENDLKCIPCNVTLHLWRDYDHRTSRTSENYAKNYYLNLKLEYFLKLDYNSNKTLVVWGAGAKGKKTVKYLIDKKLNIKWICDNPNKIGKDIYGTKLLHYSILQDVKESQCIVTVANENDQNVIREHLFKLGLQPMKDFFFFC